MKNRNIGCIEIYIDSTSSFNDSQKNRNIGCIEMNRKGHGKQIVGTKNRNIGCIEIVIECKTRFGRWRRTVTLDVLKLDLRQEHIGQRREEP